MSSEARKTGLRFPDARPEAPPAPASGATAADAKAARAVVRRAIEAFDHDDWSTLRELLHPQMRFHPLRGMGRFAVGRSRVMDSMCTLKQAETTIRLGALDVLEDGRVLALGTVRRGADAHPFAAIHEVRNGQIVDARHYFSDVELLQELGIVGTPTGTSMGGGA